MKETSEPRPILVVDDDLGLLAGIQAALLSGGLPAPVLASDSREVMELVEKHSFHVILLDLMMPHVGGMELLKQIKKRCPEIECVIVTALNEVSRAVEAMRYGAYDYLVKPFQRDKLLITIQRALERYDLCQSLSLHTGQRGFGDLQHPEAFKEMVAADERMATVFHQAELFAPTDYNILLSGETGTGKEMLARIIHRLSRRAGRPFVALNMAAIQESLFEDALFGHRKGAFTDASADRQGLIQAAAGGTLFLDEITELNPALQAKLLRVIQERSFFSLGSDRASIVDVRILAATNQDLQEAVETGRLRRDLFYRIAVCHIHIPPLRERKQDLLPLARHFMRRHAAENRKAVRRLSKEMIQALLANPFPGNVRELENIIAASVLREDGPELRPGPELAGAGGSERRSPLRLAEVERQHVLHVVKMTGGNRSRAARILGIGLRTLQRKLKQYQETSQAAST